MKNKYSFLFILFILFVFAKNVNAQATLLSEGFEGGVVPPTGWTSFASTTGGYSSNTWSVTTTSHTGSDAAEYLYSATRPANAWLISKGLSLCAGQTYTISYYQEVGLSSFPENLQITVGTNITVAAQTTTLQTLASLTNTSWVLRTCTYTPGSSGTYYFGWNCYSAADQDVLYIDDILIQGTSLTCGGSTICQTYTTSGTTNTTSSFTVPAGVTSMTVNCWGGGGGGGGTNGDSDDNGGGGGGGGAFSNNTITVSAGQVYTYTVGGGGAGGASGGGNGGTGGVTKFTGTGGTITANSGTGGGGASGGTGGTVGSGGTGTHNGGNGSVGVRSNQYEIGGAGGGSGGSTTAGGNGTAGTTGGPTSAVGGSAGTGTYPGAQGASASYSAGDIAGVAGSTPGSGGSGSASYHNSEGGGIGGAGEIVVCYVVASICSGTPSTPTIAVTPTVNATNCAASYTTALSATVSASNGVTNQWQQSIDGGTTWTDITGATNTTYTATVTQTTWYWCISTCGASGLSATSPSVQAVLSCTAAPTTNTTIPISSCPTSITFYDDGGIPNYTTASTTFTTVITVPAGSCLNANFTSFTTYTNATSSHNDFLTISSGGTTIGTYSGTTSPGLIVSPTNTLTFVWTKKGFGNAAGWVANITCGAIPSVSVSVGEICNGISDEIDASGATSYTWNPGGLTGSSITVSPSVNTTYTVTGSNGTCTSKTVATETVDPVPALTVVATSTAICSGNTTTLTASGAAGTTFSWITPPTNQTTANLVVSPTATTIYTVVATNTLNACTTTKTVSINVTTSPTVSVNSPTTCAGQAVTLTASGATNYTWSPGGATGATHPVTQSSTTTYTVIGSNGGICADTAIAVVTVNCVQTSSTQTINLTCPATYTFYDSGGPSGNYGNNENYSVTFIAPAGSCLAAHFSSYASQNNCTDQLNVYNGSSTASPTVNVGGSGYYFFCDANASSLTSNTITSSGNALTFSFISNNNTNEAGWIASITCGGTAPTVGSATICSGNTTTLTASGASSYTWSANASNATSASVVVSPTTTTVYTVTSSSSGCNATATSTVTVCNNGGQVISSANNLCPGYTTTLSIVGASCAAGYQWQSSSDNTTWANIGSATSATYSTTINQSTYYQCILTLSGGCGTSTASAAYCQAQCQAGVANVSNNGSCRGSYTQTLTLTGSSCVTGYQWQSSTDGTTWSNISSATTVSTVVTVTANTYYQCAITCAGGNNNASSYVYCTYQNSGATNDDCGTPTQIPTAALNGTWLSGFNTACATYDTQNSCAGVSGCGNSLPNQWFTFTAQGPNIEISALGDNSDFNPVISIYKGSSCGGLTLVTCFGEDGNSVVNDNNGASGSSSNFTIITGQQYYVMVTQDPVADCRRCACSDFYNYPSSFQLQINNPPPNPRGTDCATAQIVCSNGNYGGAAQLWGTQELGNGSVADCNLNEEVNSGWYILNILQGGTLTFTIAPVDQTDDYDFAMYKGATCSLGSPVSCNYSEYTNNNAQTGISTAQGGYSSHTSAVGGQWNNDLTVSAGDVYLMYINGFTPTSNSFNFSFGGTAVLGCTLPVVLPVELLAYTASYNDMGSVNINWSTATETDCKSFTVEKSQDGMNFNFVGQKAGAGNSQSKKDYAMVDSNPYAGLSYYRLKQTDYNGNEKFYNQIAVNVLENTIFKVKPNPVVTSAEVEYNCVTSEQATLRIYDSQGTLVSEMNFDCSAGKNKSTVSFEGLPAGLYIVTLSTSTSVYQAKVVK